MLSLSAFAVTAQQYYPVRDRMEVTSLDGTWQFRLENESEWRMLRVPGNWETQGVKTPEYGRNLSPMTGHYRRTFEFQPDWQGREVILRLDGVQNGFTAYVNGHEAGSGHSGHTMHQFAVTPWLKEGSNEITIDVTTQSEYWLFDVCDAWSVTGIQHSVELFSVPKEGSLADIVFTSKVKPDNSADITVMVKTNGSGVHHVTASLLDERYNHVADMQATEPDGSETEANSSLSTPKDLAPLGKSPFKGDLEGPLFTLHSSLKSPRLWNAETPHLYRLDVKLFDAQGRKLQAVQEKVGIREVRVENGKILLNNREIFLRGACLSENDAVEGSAMSQLNRRRQLEQMKQANINFIRTAHYPLDPVFTRLCDEMGFYVCEEIPFASRGDQYLKGDSNVVTELKSRAKATIDRDRNCPSIIMWSHGNENKIYRCQDSVLLFTKEYDPTRLRGVPQAKGAFLSYIKRPSKYVDVICGHYANDGVLKQACEESKLPIINTEYAHAVGTSFGDLEHKYEIFRREPMIAGGSVWSYQDQSILTRNFNQQHQVLKGVRVDSVRYIDCFGLNPLPEGLPGEKNKEGTDGVVYGDGYPQEDYFELAQVYTPVYITDTVKVRGESVEIQVENRFDFISLHGYSIRWQLRYLQKVWDEGTEHLKAEARETETVTIPIEKIAPDMILSMQVLRPDGSLCFERNSTVFHEVDWRQRLAEAKGAKPKTVVDRLKKGLLLRVGRSLSVNLDYRRERYWFPYLLESSALKVKKQKGVWHLTCRWQLENNPDNYVDGDIRVATDKQGTVTIDYTLTPGDSVRLHILDFGPAFQLPEEYTQVAWLGRGPFSQTPDKTACNNRDIWRLHRDDIRFDGNRADVDLMTVYAPTKSLTISTDSRNIHLEKTGGKIVLTDNLIVGTYGTKFTPPQGTDARKLGVRQGRITLKMADPEWIETIFGKYIEVNPEQPYLESYGR